MLLALAESGLWNEESLLSLTWACYIKCAPRLPVLEQAGPWPYSSKTVKQQTLKDIKTMHPWSLTGAIAGCKYSLPGISILLTIPCLINLHCVCSNVCRAHMCIFENIRGQCWVSFLDTGMDLNPGPHGSAAGCFSHWTISTVHIPNSIHSLPFSTLSPIFLSFWS